MERFANAVRFGFDVVELPGVALAEYQAELLAARDDLPAPVSGISRGYRGSLLSADEASRRRCRADIRRLIDLCATLGARGLVIPPVLHEDRQVRLSEVAGSGSSVKEAEDRLLVDQMGELADYAAQAKVLLLLEPVNRYETDYLNTLGHAAALCRQLDHAAVGIAADFFHMQIEELHLAEAIQEAGQWIKHVHVAENTRVEPGPGSLDFGPGFKSLGQIGYEGCIVVECRSLSGPAERVLPASAEYLRQLRDEYLDTVR